MSLTVCSGCRRHVRDGEGCPFCGGRSRTAVHVWKAAVLTAMVPLGLAACYGGPVTESGGETKPAVGETKPDAKAPAVEVEPAPKPEPSDPTTPEPEPLDPTVPKPEAADADSVDSDPSGQGSKPPEPVDTVGGDSSKPEGTDTPIVKDRRPAKKYGAPPRPKPKYGGPPNPKPKPTPPPKPSPGN